MWPLRCWSSLLVLYTLLFNSLEYENTSSSILGTSQQYCCRLVISFLKLNHRWPVVAKNNYSYRIFFLFFFFFFFLNFFRFNVLFIYIFATTVNLEILSRLAQLIKLTKMQIAWKLANYCDTRPRSFFFFNFHYFELFSINYREDGDLLKISREKGK